MTADKAVEAIWRDITGRSGGDAFLETIDPDIQDDIKQQWLAIIHATRQQAYQMGLRKQGE